MDPFDMEIEGTSFFVPVVTNRGRVGYAALADRFRITVTTTHADSADLLARKLTEARHWQAEERRQMGEEWRFTKFAGTSSALTAALREAYRALSKSKQAQVQVNRFIPETVDKEALLPIAWSLGIEPKSRWSKEALFDAIDAKLPG